MGEVIRLSVNTTLPLPVDVVLDGAKDCEYVLVLGYDKDGKLAAGTSTGNLETAVYIATQFIAKVMAGDYD